METKTADRLIICEECGGVFDSQMLDNVKAENKNYKGITVSHQYYQCPDCKTKYTIRYTSPDVRKLSTAYQKQIAEARKTLDTIRALSDEMKAYFEKAETNQGKLSAKT